MDQAVVQSSCERLRSAIVDKATMRLDFTGNLQKMLEQLEAIDAVIPNAEGWWTACKPEDAERDDGRKWQSKVEDATNRVCIVMDELQELTVPPTGKKMARMLGCRENIIIDPEIKDLFLDEMMEITEKLKELLNESAQFDDIADIREALLQAPEAIVGREADLRMILAQLSAGLPFGEKGPIILHIFTGGDEQSVGRATMAALVFNHNRFKCYSRIWIHGTSMLYLHEIGKHIISQLVPAGEEEITGTHVSDDDIGYITSRLHDLLNGKKVLIVLHDIWMKPIVWSHLKDMLSGGGAGGTGVIVIATGTAYEDRDVKAMEIIGVQRYHLDPLNVEMCCRIIKQAALRSKDHTSADREHLERIAEQAAELCDGSPFSAQLYGAALQFKQYTEWAEQDLSDDLMMLMLTHMPPDLRLCFDYCALLFIRAREIAKEDLIHQWIALDVIKPSEMFSIPQLAEQYLRRLLDMSLLQTAVSSRTSAKDGTCAILFTMHEAVKKCAVRRIDGTIHGLDEDHNYYYYTEQFSYVSFLHISNEDIKRVLTEPNIRALSFVGCSQMKPRSNLFSSTRCLRVLELHESSIRKLPESICQLMDLGYLKLSGWSGLVTLPESIGGLTKLLHVDLSSCSGLVNLPGSFGKLINLVHISLSGCSKLANLPESFRKLIKLVYIDLSGSAIVNLPEFFGQMINLVHINLSGCLALENLPRSFGKLTKLEHINLIGCPKLVNLPRSFGKLTNLVHISLSGCNGLETLPGSFGKLTKLEHVNLSGCPKILNLPDSLGKLTNLVHINLSGCNGLVNLPGSFGGLRSLVHINLSGCSGLEELPGSFGKLISLVHVNLSGCYGLEELPQSFGKLISLVHINLSGCSGLAALPSSFGELKNVLHINLSHCYGLSKLPELFRKLKKLVHLDLSFWSCFEGIQTALSGLNNLQHLNLSRPCCYRADYHHLKELKEVLSQFSRLKHLNLSMFLNPIFCNQSEVENLEYIDFISGFSGLEYLDLSHNIFLRDLPEGLSGLGRLHTVDLSGCIKLKKVGQWMDSMQSLRSVVLSDLESYQFVAGAYNVINNYGQLVDVRCKELQITHLEEMEPVEERRRIKLTEKQNLQKLKLCWTVSSQETVEANALIEELVPPHSLQHLELCGYGSTCFPSWLTSSSSISSLDLVDVIMEDIPNCSSLPPLGLLQNLQRVVLRRMNSITRINVGELIHGNTEAFNRLSKFTIDDMVSLEEFTYYSGGGDGPDGYGVEEFLLPLIDELVVSKCPNLSFVPLPPRAQKVVISDCNYVMVGWRNNGVESPSWISYPVTEVTELVVEYCKVDLSNWYLLHYLPGISSLTIKNCDNLISSPEIIEALSSLERLCFSECQRMDTLPEHLGGLSSLRKLQIKSCKGLYHLSDSMRCLTSLQSMHFSDCEEMRELPEWLGSLSSLQKLTIERCANIFYLPQSIGELSKLKDLHIMCCPSLEGWFRSYDNRKTLGHIRPRIEETPTSEQEQSSEREDDSD